MNTVPEARESAASAADHAVPTDRQFAAVSGTQGLVLARDTTGPGPAASSGTPGGPGPWLPSARADAHRTDEVACTPPSGYGQPSFQHPDGMIHGDPCRGNLPRDGHHAVTHSLRGRQHRPQGDRFKSLPCGHPGFGLFSDEPDAASAACGQDPRTLGQSPGPA